MKFCQRCNAPLKGSYDVITNPSPTGPGSTIFVCKGWCQPAPIQTAQQSARR